MLAEFIQPVEQQVPPRRIAGFHGGVVNFQTQPVQHGKHALRHAGRSQSGTRGIQRIERHAHRHRASVA